MPTTASIYHVLVASPSDCHEERKAIRDLLHRWNLSYGLQRDVRLEPLMWEEEARPEFGDSPQNIINRQLTDKADILIALFWTRLGTPTNSAESGTAEEVERFLSTRRPVLAYFSQQPVIPSELEPEQLSALNAYRRRLEELGLLAEYDTSEDLVHRVERHLTALIEVLIRKTESSDVTPLIGTAALARLNIATWRQELEHPQQQRALSSPKAKDYDLVFEPSKSSEFYNLTADYYDARNSDDLLASHFRVISEIRSAVSTRRRHSVLDLGGGTGIEIANHFAPRREMNWYYVDSSEEMVRTFARNFRRAEMSRTIIYGDAVQQASQFADEGDYFDVVVMSWLLSSMPGDFNLSIISQLLRPSSRLIIADAHPSHLAVKPLYGVDTDGKRLALRPRSVDPNSLMEQAKSAGLELSAAPHNVCKDDGTIYAFVHVYQKRR